MAMATVGPGFVALSVQPWSGPAAITAPAPAAAAPANLPAASPSAGSPSVAQDAYGGAPIAPAAAHGKVEAKDIVSNLWDSFFGPLLGGLFSAISTIFQGW